MEKPVYKVVSTADEFQMAMCIRSIVFVDEQACPYAEEFDGLDLTATHFIALAGGEPFATARIRFVRGAVKFERLAVRRQYRGNGTGRDFFRYILGYIDSLGYGKIKLHAQAHLTGFYEGFGFMKKGGLFNEANIPHYLMERGPD